MSESFDATWLALREPADAWARDPALAERLVSLLPKRPHLVDLGAGTGSLFRWLAPRVGGAQAWTLVDGDAALVEEAFDTIARRAEGIGLARRIASTGNQYAWHLADIAAPIAAPMLYLASDGPNAINVNALP